MDKTYHYKCDFFAADFDTFAKHSVNLLIVNAILQHKKFSSKQRKQLLLPSIQCQVQHPLSQADIALRL